MDDLKRLSRFISLVLRHKASEFGIDLDRAGYVELDMLHQVIQEHYRGQYAPALFDQLMQQTTRFEIHDGKIRALYGHSAVSDIEYPPAEPPEYLYHGTVRKALDNIRREGLTSRGRQYVHLSTGLERATEVASRRGTAIILTVRALKAYQSGIVFHHPEPSHYLAKTIPPQFIEFPD